MTAEVVMRTFGGMTIRNLTRLNIKLIVDALLFDEYVIVEYEGETDLNVNYVQARHRPEGDYQIEYRSGGPSEHYQTITDSRDKVVEALFAWSRQEDSWRGEFEWKNIGDLFSG
jgi:hypothetical protein